MEYPVDDDDLGPCSRSRSNTWPRLARVNAPEPSPPLPSCYPNYDVTGPRPREMDVIAEVPTDGDDAAASKTARPTGKPRNAWGNASYADIIATAITSAPEKRLTLSQIYRWMEDQIPYFRSSGSASPGGSGSAGWKNSVRHNLSLLDRFVRMQNEDKGQSSWWTVDPDAKPGRGGRTRRRAASMETSKANEQRRGRVLERVRSLRRAKQQDAPVVAEAAALTTPLPATCAACPADQLASSLGQYMALRDGSGQSGSAYPTQRPRDSGDSSGHHRGYPQERHVGSGTGSYTPALSQSPSLSPSPPRYQQLPTFLQDDSSPPYDLPTVLPRPAAVDMRPTRRPLPPPPCLAAYQTQPDPYQPMFPPPHSVPPPASHQYDTGYATSYETPSVLNAPSTSDDLGLPLYVDAGLNCDVDAVLRQELILEGNLDFNFSQPNLQYGVPYVSHSLII